MTITLVFLLAGSPLTAWLGWLFVLAALSRRPLPAPAAPGSGPRLIVVVPAHNEEAGLAHTLSALRASDYDPGRFCVVVVADNCTDNTAAVARQSGVRVIERSDPSRRGKGHALRLAFTRLVEEADWDAVVVCDADAIPAPDALRRLAARLAAGGEVMQSRYGVLDPDRTWFTRLTDLAFRCKTDWQYPGMVRLGMSIPLRGSGMAFSRRIIEKHGWSAASLTEDLDFSLDLLLGGQTVAYAPEAGFWHYMPPSPQAAQEQRRRWSAGETELARRRLVPFLATRLRQGRWREALAGLQLVTPPFSLNFLASMVLALLGGALWLAGSGLIPVLAGVGLCLGHAAYFCLPAPSTGNLAGSVTALLRAPWYALWRGLIHIRVLLPGGRPRQWLRTERTAERPLRVAILGTRGVPACYGGFETCAQEVGRRLALAGFDVSVYCRCHFYHERQPRAQGMTCLYLPCVRNSSLETLSHATLSALHATVKRFDVVLAFNSAVAPCLLPLRLIGTPICLNTDGMEWKRGKWGRMAKTYYRLAEKLACVVANRVVTDSESMARYYQDTHNTPSTTIAYGAEHIEGDALILPAFGLEPRNYFLQITRFEPENNPLVTLRAFRRLNRPDLKLVLVGGSVFDSDYSRAIAAEVEMAGSSVVMCGFCYARETLAALRSHCLAYVHGNEVGGTNPALLEAMASGAFVLARDCIFNREVLADCGRYFVPEELDLAKAMSWVAEHSSGLDDYREKAKERILGHYTWEGVAAAYATLVRETAAGKYPWRLRWPFHRGWNA